MEFINKKLRLILPIYSTIMKNKFHHIFRLLKKCWGELKTYQMIVFNVLHEFEFQAGLIGVQLLWTKEAEIAIKRARFDRVLMKITNQRFLDLLNSLIDLTSKDLTKMQRIQFETMVTIHVHQRDIFDNICKLRVKSLLDFEWQAQTRFYYNEENDEIIVRITDVIFLYQNEYLGITERLAITPLTDRCYITLAQAICKYLVTIRELEIAIELPRQNTCEFCLQMFQFNMRRHIHCDQVSIASQPIWIIVP